MIGRHLLGVSILVIVACAFTNAALASRSEPATHTYKLLYSFCAEANCADGVYPNGTLAIDSDGNLFGTTNSGGAHKSGGTVFELTSAGKEIVLHNFCAKANCADGANPYGGVIIDKAGNFYGTTAGGGAHAVGTVFKLTSAGKEIVLHSFCAEANCADGEVPYAGLIMDKAGNLYGTTFAGGGVNSAGTAFKLMSGGKEIVLHRFCAEANCADGADPEAGVIIDKAGNLYGTTTGGGINSGTVFKLRPSGMEAISYGFCAKEKRTCTAGAVPYGLIMDKAGNLYGTTGSGGAHKSGGTVFKLTPSGKETVLHSFCTEANCADGESPFLAGLVMDGAQNLYGTTSAGGAHNGGTIFKLTPSGKETVLYSLCAEANCADGELPYTGLIMDEVGNLYGTTSGGGAHGGGTVFELIRR